MSRDVAFAQTQQAGFGIEGMLLGGRIFKHTVNFRGPIPASSQAADVFLLWKTNGKKAWQQRRHYPTVGVGITATNYDNRYYGQSIGIYPALELPLLRRKNWEWTTRFGMGLGYISKHYTDYAPDWDTLNNAMGGHINNFTLLQSSLRRYINDRWAVQLGFAVTHMSSAKFRLPNLGINFLGVQLGVRYLPQSRKENFVKSTLPKVPNRLLLQVRQGFGLSTGESIGSAARPVYFTSVYLSRRYWAHNKVYAGIDYSFHRSIYDFQRLQGIAPGNEAAHAWKSAVFAGHEFLYGRAGLMLQMGFYIKQAALPSAPIYQKIGINWYLLQREKGPVKEVALSAILKTHYATAEVAEWGLGMSF